MRDSNQRLEDLGLTVLALSCDPMFALRVFSDTERFPFDLLTDWWPHGRIAQQYGVFDSELGCALRGTFRIDPDGVIDYAAASGIGERRDFSPLFRDGASSRPG